MSQQTFALLFLLGAVAFETGADALFKVAATGHRSFYFWLGFALYAIGTLAWASSLKYEFLAKAISIFTVLNLIAVVLLGVIVFHESLSLANKLGILFGVVSVVLLQM